MIPDLKPYPAMKESSVPWLGRVPKHWETRRAKYSLREADERSVSGQEELLSVSHITGVTSRREKNVTMFLAASNVGHKLCRPGDIVINTMWAWMAALGVSGRVGLVSPSYGVYRQRPRSRLVPGYVDRLLRTEAYRAEYVRRSTGINSSRLRLYPEQFLSLPMIQPPEAEQVAIVRFLDHADRRIRRFIVAKKKLIALLNEEKQAIIHHAVTRGLDPNVRLKPSGIEWLGDVPAHWAVVPTKRACSLLRDGTHLPPPRQASGFPLLSVRNIVGDRFARRLDDSHISEDHFNELCRSFLPRANDVLLAVVGATLGKVATIPEMEPFQIQRSLALLRPRPDLLDFRFLAAFLRGPAFQRALWETVAFSAQPGIYLNTLGAFCVPVPPLSEQHRIVARLEGETAHMSSAIVDVERELCLVGEYRTRLIADVVTGKLDVREAAARLPDGAPEPEPLEDSDDIAGAVDEAESAHDDTEGETDA